MKSPSSQFSGGGSRPGLAMIVNANTPYRTHLHRRIAREIPEVKLHSIFTHGVSNSPWVIKPPAEINAVNFGEGEGSETAARSVRREWAKAGRIIRYIEENDIRCVVLHGYNDAGRVRLFRYCHGRGIPVFLWGDSNVKSDQVSGIKRVVKSLVLKFIFSQTSGFMSCGTLGRDYFVRYGADAGRVYFVPYEPDYEEVAGLPEESIRKAAEVFSLAQGRRRLVYSGRLVREKRVDLLIRGFNEVAKERPEWDVVIVGDGVLRKELEGLVSAELKDRVKFLGFQSEQAMVSAVYRNSDALCLPSEYEPWALVINEAAAAGLALISSDVVGASAEILEDGVNGKFFTSRDLDSATAAIRFVTDPNRIDTLRRNSPLVLERWRQRGDPVGGLRRAMEDFGVMKSIKAR